MFSTIRVAFATTDRKQVNQHFGTAASFVIYDIDQDRASLVEVVQFTQIDQDGQNDKLSARIEALTGCVAVYCQAIGASAINRLLPLGVQPFKLEAGTAIAHTIGNLQLELRESPSAWLARAIEHRQPGRESRFDLMEAEGWNE